MAKYDIYYEWSDGELTNDTVDGLIGVIESLMKEERAIRAGSIDYEDVHIIAIRVTESEAES